MKLCMGCMKQIEEHLAACPYCGFNETALRQESYYLDPGTVIGGKYIVGRVMSYGGHTVSYLGLDAEAGRKVVVKEYLPSDFSTRSEGEKEVTIYSGDAREQFVQGLTNFLNEANRIQHLAEVDGIARVYDCVAENDTGYVISEYVEGKTLREILESGRKYTVEEARRFISQILAGLSKVHPLDIVHCDISPDSIMVADNGTIKLLDFGATRYVTTANSKSLAIILKQGYAPEEQYRSQGVRGPWTDVYALGAVMYRMITGITPQESVERTLIDDLKEPSKLGVKISQNIENALMNALNVYQQDRTPSAEVFLQELNSPEVMRKKVRKRKNETGKFPLWIKILVAVLLCVVIVGGLALHKMSVKDVETVVSTSEKMIDLSGKTMEAAKEYANSLNKKHHGWDIKVQENGTIFDADPAKDGTIAIQTIPAETEFTKPDKKLAGILEKGKKGAISATIACTLFSNKVVSYEEIRDITNAYALAKKLAIDTSDTSKETRFCPEKKKNTNYYDLAYLKPKYGEPISFEDIQDEQKAKELIEIDGLEIHYYASDFFYWKKMIDFKGENLYELEKYPLYQKGNEKEVTEKKKGKKQIKAKLEDSSLVDKSYYTFENYKPGYIWEQTVPKGEKFDGSEQREEPLLKVVGQQISFQGETGAAVKNKVSWPNTKVMFDKNGGSMDQVVESVTVTDQNGVKKHFFKKDETLVITIKTKEEEVPTPVPQEERMTNNRSSSKSSSEKDTQDAGGLDLKQRP